ncbi:hypothetical protein DMA11_01475 [Marinilabiliaceae bacterium JC017]|nr:hypothetical protein DMA11_01475 [Marinilabiliaceae bacterium JC017]
MKGLPEKTALSFFPFDTPISRLTVTLYKRWQETEKVKISFLAKSLIPIPWQLMSVSLSL